MGGESEGRKVKIIGIDPGLANFGIAVFEVIPPTFVRVEVWRTKPDHKARRIRKADDTADRCRELGRQLLDLVDERVIAIAVEAVALPHGKIQTSVVSALGRVRGLIDAVAELHRLPVLEETPQAVKRRLCGDRSASKDAVRQELERRYPRLSELWPPQKTLLEHAGDAAAVAHLALDSDVVQAAVRARGAAWTGAAIRVTYGSRSQG